MPCRDISSIGGEIAALCWSLVAPSGLKTPVRKAGEKAGQERLCSWLEAGIRLCSSIGSSSEKMMICSDKKIL